MPKKTDISAYKTPTNPPILKTAQEAAKAKVEKGKRGRKPKATAQKESEVVALKLTPAEKKALEKKAGLTPVATYLKHYLRTDTKIFE